MISVITFIRAHWDKILDVCLCIGAIGAAGHGTISWDAAIALIVAKLLPSSSASSVLKLLGVIKVKTN